MPAGARMQWDEGELRRLLDSPDGPLGQDFNRRGELGAQEAKRLCPVSPHGHEGRPSGTLRSTIAHEVGRDSQGLFVDVGTDDIVGLYAEVGTGPHVIRSHGDYPLRDAAGHVFGREVQHPGTEPQPFLRPALDVMER
jgi:hypothetical protein